MHPSFTDNNPAPAIVLIGSRVLVHASPLHGGPYPVFARPYKAVFQSVANAAAAFCMPALQLVSANRKFFSAMTPASIEMLASMIFMRNGKNRASVENKSAHVFMCWHDVIISQNKGAA